MIAVGGTVGNYLVERKIGEGAMGKVFLASHPTIGKRVALKVIHAELSSNEEMLSRFFQEARAVTQIGHHNIVDVQDFGQTPDGDSFIVMELLEGQSLAAAIAAASGALPCERALHIARQIADGLAAAHALGIIHRDLKPDNIILVARGGDPDFVKILDFGLAKLTGLSTMSHKTKTGSLLGTPHYMAPEQAEGKKIDHRVDVYALGCLLFQMVTGRVPFPGEGFGEVLVKQLREPPPLPSRLNPSVPPSVEKIVLHALAKKPQFRFPTMEAFKAALDEPATFQQQLESAEATGAAPSLKMPAANLSPVGPILVPPPSAPLKLPVDAPTVRGAAPHEVQAAVRAAARSRMRAPAPTGELDRIPRQRWSGMTIGFLVGLLAFTAVAAVLWLRKPQVNRNANANANANGNAKGNGNGNGNVKGNGNVNGNANGNANGNGNGNANVNVNADANPEPVVETPLPVPVPAATPAHPTSAKPVRPNKPRKTEPGTDDRVLLKPSF